MKGPGQNRTGVRGFAGRCLTARPNRRHHPLRLLGCSGVVGSDRVDTRDWQAMSAQRQLDLREQEFIGDYCVSTVALGIEHNGGTWYETYIFPADGKKITDWGEVWGVRYVTREGAVSGHADTCEKLRAGTLEGLDAA